MSKEEEAKRLREIGCDDLANELDGEPYDCKKCKNDDKINCKECGCAVCGGKEYEEELKHLLFCEECQY